MSDADIEYGLLDGPRAQGIAVDDLDDGRAARRAEVEHLVRTENRHRFSRRHGLPVRPPWQSRWRFYLHRHGLCVKNRLGYTCHARTPIECP